MFLITNQVHLRTYFSQGCIPGRNQSLDLQCQSSQYGMQHWVAINDLELSVRHKLVAADKIIKDPLKKSLKIAIIFLKFFLNLDLGVKT